MKSQSFRENFLLRYFDSSFTSKRWRLLIVQLDFIFESYFLEAKTPYIKCVVLLLILQMKNELIHLADVKTVFALLKMLGGNLFISKYRYLFETLSI